MITLGVPLIGTVKSIGNGSCILSVEGTDVPMNIWELPPKSKPGKEFTVFVYNDSKESLKATRQTPLAKLNDFAVLTVKEVKPWGAFLEWGIQKDLFLPQREQNSPVRELQKIIIRVIMDHEQTGLIATSKLDSHFKYDTSGLNNGDDVEMLVFASTKLGYPVVVNNSYRGMLYRNEVFTTLEIGEKVTGIIKNIREDGRLDCSLQQVGFVPAMEDARETILKTLKSFNGFLPLHDKSSPDEIASILAMSKKNFKRALGILYKERIVRIDKDGISLNRSNKSG